MFMIDISLSIKSLNHPSPSFAFIGTPICGTNTKHLKKIYENQPTWISGWWPSRNMDHAKAQAVVSWPSNMKVSTSSAMSSSVRWDPSGCLTLMILLGKRQNGLRLMVSIARLLAPFYHLVLDLSYSISNHETHVPTNGVSTEPFLTVDRK